MEQSFLPLQPLLLCAPTRTHLVRGHGNQALFLSVLSAGGWSGLALVLRPVSYEKILALPGYGCLADITSLCSLAMT